MSPTWLAKLLRFVPKEEREGIALQEARWLLRPPRSRDLAALLRSLPLLFPDGGMLYVEGTSIAREVEDFLEARQVPPVSVRVGTIWPRPKRFHLPLLPEHLDALSRLAENHAFPEICDHILVYRGDEVLLEGYDLFSQEIVVSREVGEALVGQFARATGWSYEPFPR